jgi:hypothetical protein
MSNEYIPAFPQSIDDGEERTYYPGMQLRDYFAAKAMQANYAAISEFPDEHWRVDLAKDAYTMADAMMKARKT